MSKMKNPKVNITAKFSGLVDGLARAQEAFADVVGGLRAAREADRYRYDKRKAKRRRQGKAARSARRFNRRPTKRPKGRRKP